MLGNDSSRLQPDIAGQSRRSERRLRAPTPLASCARLAPVALRARRKPEQRKGASTGALFNKPELRGQVREQAVVPTILCLSQTTPPSLFRQATALRVTRRSGASGVDRAQTRSEIFWSPLAC